jgi:hypothetical protein
MRALSLLAGLAMYVALLFLLVWAFNALGGGSGLNCTEVEGWNESCAAHRELREVP